MTHTTSLPYFFTGTSTSWDITPDYFLPQEQRNIGIQN